MKITKAEALNLLDTYCDKLPPCGALERLMDTDFEISDYQKGFIQIAKEYFVSQWIVEDVIYNQSGHLTQYIDTTPAFTRNTITI